MRFNYIIFVLFILFFPVLALAQMPDTVGNSDGWRYATSQDVAYWDNVNSGDVIIFSSNTSMSDIDTRQYSKTISIYGGSKIHIWRGSYARILLSTDGIAEKSSSKTKPIIITNLGGQVRWGDNQKNDYRGFEILGLNHVYVSGNYDPDAGTGHPDFPGMFGDMTKQGWIYRFGLMGDQKFYSFRNNDSHGLGFEINSFTTARVEGVAVMHGYFAGFSIKNNTGDLTQTSITVEYCLSGWHEGEGYYIGYNGSVDGSRVSENQTIFRNNIALFTGYEAIQTDFMSSGSVVENNFVYKSGCFYQIPFQGDHYQDNGIQWSFTESGVAVQNNIIYSGNSGSISIGPRYKDPGLSRRGSPGEIQFTNNLLGQSKRSVGYIFQGDSQDEIAIKITNNIIDSIPPKEVNDAYNTDVQSGFINIGNSTNDIYLYNNIYPTGRSLFYIGNGDGSNVTAVGNYARKAPALLLHDNFGFNPDRILKFIGVWFDGHFGDAVDASGAITYYKGDVVYTLTKDNPVYYKCIQQHSSPKNPTKQPLYWEKLQWNNQDEPAYTPLLKTESFYNYRKMGLTFSEEPQQIADTIPPVIEVSRVVRFNVGEIFNIPQANVSDNVSSGIEASYTFPIGVPGLSEANRFTQACCFTIAYDAVDEAGNRAEQIPVKCVVGYCNEAVTQKSQLNFHTYKEAAIYTKGNYWTDIAETNEGVVSNGITQSVLRDTNGVKLPWTVTVFDNVDGVESMHYGVNKEDKGVAIGDFPADVTEQGLRLREGIETKCLIVFNGLDISKYYSISFTGYMVENGDVFACVSDSASRQSVIFNVVHNDKTYSLENLKPNNEGTICLYYEFCRSQNVDWRATSSLAGMIITEKQYDIGSVVDDCNICVDGNAQPQNCVEQKIVLKQGLNLVSFNVNPAEHYIPHLFPNAKQVHTLDLYWNRIQEEYFNTLTSTQMGEGYIIVNDIDETIVITGHQSVKNSTLLIEGWNLVGVPLQTSFSVTNLPEEIDIIKDFNGYYEPGNNLSNISELVPGKAYLIKVRNNCTINWK